MNYYQHHIGDFMRDTAHLSPLEECFYRRAIDWYYANEKPLPLELNQVNRFLRANTKTDKVAVVTVLSDFFKKTASGFVHTRCEMELEKFRSKAEANRENGKLGGRPKKNSNLNNHYGFCSVSDGLISKTQKNPNQEPITNNQEPVTNNQEPVTSNQYKYTFDLNTVNTKLKMAGRFEVDQKYIDQLQSQFELYYADQYMVENKALVKFVQWIMRNQDSDKQKQVATYQTSQQRTASEMDRWRQAEQQILGGGELDVTPKKPVLIEEVGHA